MRSRPSAHTLPIYAAIMRCYQRTPQPDGHGRHHMPTLVQVRRGMRPRPSSCHAAQAVAAALPDPASFSAAPGPRQHSTPRGSRHPYRFLPAEQHRTAGATMPDRVAGQRYSSRPSRTTRLSLLARTSSLQRRRMQQGLVDGHCRHASATPSDLPAVGTPSPSRRGRGPHPEGLMRKRKDHAVMFSRPTSLWKRPENWNQPTNDELNQACDAPDREAPSPTFTAAVLRTVPRRIHRPGGPAATRRL